MSERNSYTHFGLIHILAVSILLIAGCSDNSPLAPTGDSDSYDDPREIVPSETHNTADLRRPNETIRLSAPSNLIARNAENTSDCAANLKWQDNSLDEVGFVIMRKTRSTEAWRSIGHVDANTVRFHDRTVRHNQTYYYCVQAYSSALQSRFSNTAQFTTYGKSIFKVPVNI